VTPLRKGRRFRFWGMGMAKKNGAKAQDGWRNRIVNFGTKPASQFQANPLNPKVHPQNQRNALAASLRELGWVGVCIENARTGQLIDGHERIWQALQNGDADVPYIQVDLSPEEERLMLATFDPIAALAVTDKAMLASLLEDVQSSEAALQQMLAELAVRTGITPPNDPMQEWQGMPEFEQEDAFAFKTIKIHFTKQEDVDAFAELLDQTVTAKTKYLWFPEQEEMALKEYKASES